jgi:WD40 repeat protein
VLPDGRILSWADDKTLRIWDAQSGACLITLEGHTDPVNGATVLPDGRILSWADDKTLRIWDAQSGACLTALEGHTSPVWGATVLPDGRILSWAHDATLRIWDAQSGACLAILEGHTDDIWGATVLPDGRILSWSHDATLRIWDAQSGACLGSWKTINAASKVPDLWRIYQQETNADTLTLEAEIDPLARGISCIFPELKKRILWQGEGEWKAHHLWSEGKIVVSCHKHLEFLPLYSGRKRVTLAEAHEILQNTQNN